MQEGVIKFRVTHRSAPLAPGLAALAAELDAWRSILVQLELLGCDPRRYDGLGFGNISARVPTTAPGESPSFLISGSQTGAKPRLALGDFCLVTSWTIAQNSLVSVGQTQPSSESLTHGAFYEASAELSYVFHAHSPEIWSQTEKLGIARTAASVPYGTPEMAREVARLCCSVAAARPAVIAMGGHQDGVFSVGETAAEAGAALIEALAVAR